MILCSWMTSLWFSVEEENRREVQLLPSPSTRLPSETFNSSMATDASDHPLLDLTLSMSVGTQRPSPGEESQSCAKSLQVLRQQTAEQIRLAAAENAYAERMREVTRMEMELAEKEYARARLVWERAREEVKKVERMKEMATGRINSACLEITCHSCHQRFRP
ncbi:protein indeterminate-domain 16-like [Musa acuminata AAA Group]|uniref:protein indeterminate-domain 16-like n=1 Tax=Musa acuminata AAA Group TaxID=214697 RepID=UPI0031D0AB6D